MRQLYVLSVDYKHFTNEERQSFLLSGQVQLDFFSYLKDKLACHGFVYLSTCNRIELYIDSDYNIIDQVKNEWIRICGVRNDLSCRMSVISGNEECMCHILQLASGIKSAIFADDQILNQLKKAFEDSRQRGDLSGLLERALQTTMRFNKKVCNETNFKRNSTSLAYSCLKVLKEKLGSKKMQESSVLIIGAGAMASDVVRYIGKFEFKSVSIMNRTYSKAQTLVVGKNIDVIPYQKVYGQNYDCIINCIDNGDLLITEFHKLKSFINLSPYSTPKPNTCSFDIQLADLQRRVVDNESKKLSELSQVHRLMNYFNDEFLKWTSQHWAYHYGKNKRA